MDRERKEKEEQRLNQYSCPTSDARKNAPTGVLLSDEVQHYVSSFNMIDPFDVANLKAAGYELTVGDEYVLGGERYQLSKDGEIRIPPFNVVVIQTAETINLPRFLIARWNVRVRWAYEGLLWVGGPQVDPGWVGHLCCPLYNLSDKEVVLRAGDQIALMDFVTTTPFNPGQSKEYRRPPKRVLLEEYKAAELKSALYELAVSKIKDFDNRINAVQGRIDNFISITFVVVGILFAAVTLFFGRSEESNWWDPSVFWICALAIIISMFAWVNSTTSVQWFRRSWQRRLFELVILGMIIATILGLSLRTQSNVKELTQQVQKLREQLNQIAPSPHKAPTPASPAQ